MDASQEIKNADFPKFSQFLKQLHSNQKKKKLNLDIKSTLVYTWSSGEVSRQPDVQIFRSLSFRCKGQLTAKSLSHNHHLNLTHTCGHNCFHTCLLLSPRSHHSSINHTHTLSTLNSVSHICMDPHKANKPHKQKEQQEISLLHKPQKQAHPVPKNGA